MKVVICEDDLVQLEQVKKIVSNYAMIEDNGISIDLATSNPEEVIDYINHNKAGCYFLDLDLNHEITGIVLGSKIREKDPLAQIIFITTHAEMSYLTFVYKIAAMDFIIKDNPDLIQAKVLSTLKEAHSRYIAIGKETKVQNFQIKANGRTRNIDFEEVYFFEASSGLHKIILHLENEMIEFYGKLKDYENITDAFYRCHKAFIVNKNNIDEIDQKERAIHMKNGEICYASARLLKGLIKK